MAVGSTTAHLVELGEACRHATTVDDLLEVALPALIRCSSASAAVIVVAQGESLDVVRAAGRALPEAELGTALLHGELPQAWESTAARVAVHDLSAETGTLLLLDAATDEDQSTALELALALVRTTLARLQAQADLSDLAFRVDHAQHLAQMGDYDWHIPTDTNRWSDELFRIYGHEPGAFQPSYDQFLSLIHPEDRERITGVHQRAYATGEPYSMIERIVRPSGEIRYLSSNGEVLMGADGVPVRMRGTCVDITARVLAENERGRLAARWRALIDSAPEAILVLDELGTVLEANTRAHDLLGGDPVGRAIGAVLPDRAGGLGVAGRRLDGRPVALDVTAVAVRPAEPSAENLSSRESPVTTQDPHDGELMAVFLRDAVIRESGEALAARLGEAKLRRRQALEINDNVVQGLVAAAYALDGEDDALATSYVQRTLGAARAMMDDLLEPLDGGDLTPGDLVRRTPATIGPMEEPTRSGLPPVAAAAVTDAAVHRVLVVDDAEDLRTLMRMRLERAGGWRVVGEAADGRAAIDRARELQPELVLLDLAMPGMDGLEALPLIREAVPGVRVIVFSGFNHATLSQQAMAAGADRYAVKGGSITELLEVLGSVVGAH